MKPLAIAALSACVMLAACSNDDDKIYSRAVDIEFKAVAGSTPIDCDTTLTLGTAGSTGKIADFRFYIHDVRVILSNGMELPVELDETGMQTDDIALLDFRNKLDNCTGAANTSMNTKLVGRVTLIEGMESLVSGLAFTVGVPFTHNHDDQTLAIGPLKNPGLASGMHWSWQGGYKFTGLDFLPDGFSRFNMHLGSTGCAVSTSDLASGVPATPCTNPNRVDVVLDGFSFEKAVQLDYAELLADSDVTVNGGGPTGCMSGTTDPDCVEIFTKLGLVHSQSGLDPLNPPEQTVFSLVDL